MTTKYLKATHLEVTFGAQIAAKGVKGDDKHIKDVEMVSLTCSDFSRVYLTDKRKTKITTSEDPVSTFYEI